MTAAQYNKMTAPIRSRKRLCQAVRLANRFTTLLVYAVYVIYILVLALRRSADMIPALAVPAVFFILLTAYRNRVNAPRPYELLDIQPIIIKQTRGHSFPSRHVFSVFIIAVTIGTQVLWLGIALAAVGVIIAVIRVIGGVHFPRDVIAGMLTGIITGLFGCWTCSFII